MKKFLSYLAVTLLGVSLMVSAFADKPHKGGFKASPNGHGGGSWPTSTAFTFDYNVGTIGTNFHAYGVAGQVGLIDQPANTSILIFWYVDDLGPVTGTGTVSCPAEELYPGTGILMIADADDIGGDGSSETNVNPIAMIEVSGGKHNQTATIQIALPQDGDFDDPGVSTNNYPVLYNGPIFTPFSWDLSSWIWNVEPAGFDQN